MQTDPAGQHFDVVIVGSGASGGWAAKRLTEAGLRVAVLEAGHHPHRQRARGRHDRRCLRARGVRRVLLGRR